MKKYAFILLASCLNPTGHYEPAQYPDGVLQRSFWVRTATSKEGTALQRVYILQSVKKFRTLDTDPLAGEPPSGAAAEKLSGMTGSPGAESLGSSGTEDEAKRPALSLGS